MNAHGERTGNGFCVEMDAIDRWGKLNTPIRHEGETELPKLAPCPFLLCKQEHIFVEKMWGGKGWQIHCATCGARGPIMNAPDDAVNTWNKTARMGG